MDLVNDRPELWQSLSGQEIDQALREAAPEQNRLDGRELERLASFIGAIADMSTPSMEPYSNAVSEVSDCLGYLLSLDDEKRRDLRVAGALSGVERLMLAPQEAMRRRAYQLQQIRLPNFTNTKRAMFNHAAHGFRLLFSPSFNFNLSSVLSPLENQILAVSGAFVSLAGARVEKGIEMMRELVVDGVLNRAVATALLDHWPMVEEAMVLGREKEKGRMKEFARLAHRSDAWELGRLMA
ncbi:hypothetical protein ACQZV8_20585 [Magnetococcales bacterium HHB-1]